MLKNSSCPSLVRYSEPGIKVLFIIFVSPIQSQQSRSTMGAILLQNVGVAAGCETNIVTRSMQK